MPLDRQFEDEVLSKALRDYAFTQGAARILDAHHFSTKHHAWVWSTIKSTWEKYRESPTPALFASKAKGEFSDLDDRVPYIELVKSLYLHKPKAARATLEELKKFVRSVNAQLAMESAARSLGNGEVEEVYGRLGSLVRGDISTSEYTLINWIEEFDDRQQQRKHKREHPEECVRIPTGIKRLDAVMSGGIELGEMGLVVATTNRGKSAMLSNFAHNALRNGHETLYVALEMPARQVAARQDSRWLKIQYNKFKKYEFLPSELREIENRWKKVKRKWANKFKIASMPVRRCDINTLQGLLDDLWQTYKFKPKIILLDSGDHMKGAGRAESYRLEQASVYRDLKGLCESGGYAIWSAVHAGREWADILATAESTAESYDKARLADVVISLNKPKRLSRSTKIVLDNDDEDTQGPDTSILAKGEYIELFLSKYRDGESKIIIPLDADFSRMTIEELEVGDGQ